MSLKSKFRGREFISGTWLTIGHESIVEVMMGQGFEWLAIDNEHSMMSLDTIQSMILATQSTGASAYVRLSHNHSSEIRKMLDAGADGLICPMINSRGDAQAFIDAVKHPPEGKRTYGLSRAQGYGRYAQKYYAEFNSKVVAIAQIEHVDAVTNLREILSVPGIDGVLTGPYDLSGSIGLPGQLEHPRVVELERQVISICKELKVSCGAHLVQPTTTSIQKKLDLGYSFLGLGTDFQFLAAGASDALKTVKELRR